MTTATVAGLGVAATTQTTFATEAPTGNTVTTAVNDKVTDKDLSDAEKRAVDTAKDADQKEKDAGQAKDELDKAQKEKDDADKDVLVKDQAKRAVETELEKAKKDDKTREAKKVQERQNKTDKKLIRQQKKVLSKTPTKQFKDAEEKLKQHNIQQTLS